MQARRPRIVGGSAIVLKRSFSLGMKSVSRKARDGAYLTDQLLASFKDLISRGALRPGEKLPPERELAQKFGVSRSSLRSALKVLDVMGVVTQRVGDGTYLGANAERALSRPLEFLVQLEGISAFELLETRLIVEPELAARAAERASAEEVAAIAASIEQMKKQGGPRFIQADAEFHKAIFKAAGNRLCDRIFGLIHRAMLDSIALTARMVAGEHTLRMHRRILDAIRKRDPEAARRAMRLHLEEAGQLIRRHAVSSAPERVKKSIRPLRKKRAPVTSPAR